jgi:hypothetical protein
MNTHISFKNSTHRFRQSAIHLFGQTGLALAPPRRRRQLAEWRDSANNTDLQGDAGIRQLSGRFVAVCGDEHTSA